MTTETAARLELLGVPFDAVGFPQALDRIGEWLQGEQFHLVITLGSEMVMHAQQDPGFIELCRRASLVVADGIGVVWAGRYCGHRVPEKVAGIELVQRLTQSQGARLRVFLLGGAPGVAEEAAAALRARSPGLQIVGVRDGFFKDDQEVISQIKASGANLLLAGLGFPRQENWLARHGAACGVAVGIGVGGTFDVLSGRLQRAPQWMIKLGVEWLYRLVLQPSRWRRMLALPHFAAKVIGKGRGAVCPFTNVPSETPQ